MAYYYMVMADELERMIASGKYRAGEKLPSLRRLRARSGRSISTVSQAYEELENRGLIEVREKSGFFVRPQLGDILPPPKTGRCPVRPHKVAINVLASLIQRTLDNPDLIPFGGAVAAESLLPGKQMAAAVRAAAAGYQDGSCSSYGVPQGHVELRREIVKRCTPLEQQGCASEIIITHGCLNAIELCLRSVAKSGDLILLESPTFLCYHQLLEDLNMQCLEIPTDPLLGLNVDELRLILEGHDVRAALVNPSFQNPQGYTMSTSAKEAFVALFAERGVPIIEDDVYGELYFGESRSLPLKFFDREGMVLYCSSFSKALLPDLRLGWTLAGKFREKVRRLKFNSSIASSQLMQRALCIYLQSGAYERHLRKLRKNLRAQLSDMGQAIVRYFPADTRISSPQGGINLWVELPGGIESLELFHRAEKENVAILPGSLCSTTGQYNHCIRLSYGHPWSDRLEEGMETLGRLAHELARKAHPVKTGTVTEEIVVGLNTDPDFLKIEGIIAGLGRMGSGFVLRFQQSISGNILKLIASGELHGGFVFGGCEDERFVVQPLATHYLRIVGPIHLKKEIEVAEYRDLARLPWIGNPAECPYSQVLENIFYARGYRPQQVIFASEESAILSMIKAGIGLNFMLERRALELASDGVLAVWGQERFAQDLSFVTLRSEQGDGRVGLIQEIVGALEGW